VKPIEQVLVLTKETKNTVRYDALRPAHDAIPNIYVMKVNFDPPYPEQIKVTIEAA